MVALTQFLASIAISAWGLAMVLLGVGGGVGLWIVVGLVVLALGVPLLASNPLVPQWVELKRMLESKAARDSADRSR